MYYAVDFVHMTCKNRKQGTNKRHGIMKTKIKREKKKKNVVSH